MFVTNMRRKFYSVLLLCLSAVFGAVPSQAYPNWIGVKSGTWDIVRDKYSYRDKVRIPVTYTNNSRNKIITMFFNKTVSTSFDVHAKVKKKDGNTFYVRPNYVKQVEIKMGSFNFKDLRWTDLNKVQLYPGQSWSMTYSFFIKVPDKTGGYDLKDYTRGNPYLKNIRWNHDFQVQSKVLAGVEPDEPDIPNRTVSVSLTNRTDATIYVALGKVSTGGNNAVSLSKGWWGVEPGRSKTLTFGAYSPAYRYYYYAFSRGGRVWSSNEKSFWIHPTKAFENHHNKPISGGKEVRFGGLRVSNDAKAGLNFTLRK